jgi:hypothetical protein
VSKTEVINAPKVLNKKEAKKYPFYKNWLDLDNAWRGNIESDYSVTFLLCLIKKLDLSLAIIFVSSGKA